MEILKGGVRYFRIQPCYYLLQIGGTIVGISGLFCFKVLPALLCIGFIKLFEAEEYEALVLAVGFWVGLLFVAWPIGIRVVGLGVRISEYGERFRYSYVEHAGADFPEPRLQDYEISEEEYKEYASQFPPDFLDDMLSVGGAAAALWAWIKLGYSQEIGRIWGLCFAIVVGMTTHIFVQWVSDRLAERYPQHEKMKQYLEAKRIHKDVQKELTGY